MIHSGWPQNFFLKIKGVLKYVSKSPVDRRRRLPEGVLAYKFLNNANITEQYKQLVQLYLN